MRIGVVDGSVCGHIRERFFDYFFDGTSGLIGLNMFICVIYF